MRKLTVGMATHDDYDGLYFTIQAIRLYNPEVLNNLEFIIVDNNPTSNHGKSNHEICKWVGEPIQYLPFTKYKSTIVKNKVFELADTPYVLCIDSHVLLEPGVLKKLIDFYDSGKDDGNLIQGPLLYDNLKNISTHFDLKWNDYMWGVWGTDNRASDKNGEPFEIPAQGCGLISCRKDSWLGYNKDFRGFGGEEGYIHEKYRKNGKKTLCLPFLRWMHRFNRPVPATYPNNLKDRVRNYFIGFTELGLDTKELEQHFQKSVSSEDMKKIKDEIFKLSPSHVQIPHHDASHDIVQ
jgi:hypothetical protein